MPGLLVHEHSTRSQSQSFFVLLTLPALATVPCNVEVIHQGQRLIAWCSCSVCEHLVQQICQHVEPWTACLPLSLYALCVLECCWETQDRLESMEIQKQFSCRSQQGSTSVVLVVIQQSRPTAEYQIVLYLVSPQQPSG